MMALSQSRTKRLVAIHGWSGVVLGLLLYVVLLTGSVVVFAFEIGSWSASGVKAQAPFERPLDGALRGLAAAVPADYRDEVSVFPNAAGHIVAFLHTHTANAEGDPDEKGVLYELHPGTHEVLARREGFGSEVFGADPWGALDEFLVELHVNLHLPDPWGLYATGLLGLLMLAAAVSGILIHRHLIRDLFVAPRLSGLLLNARDRHNLAGSWGLPFAFVLAFTGAFLSFAVALGLPTIGMVAFGGDRTAFIERLIGVPEGEDPRPAPLADIDTMLAASAAAAGSAPRGFSVRHWGRADASVTVFHLPAEGDLSAAQQVFDGPSGAHRGTKPSLGTKPSVGSAVFGLMHPLHFGSFAGLLSRTVWFVLGLAMCYVTLTGLQLWLQRRAEEPLWRRLARAVPVVGYGLPIGVAGSGIGFFLSLPAARTLFWTPSAFLIACALALAAGLALRDERRLARLYRAVLGATLIVLPLLRMAAGGSAWEELLASANRAVIVFDLVLFLAGAGFVAAAAGRSLWVPAAPCAAERIAAE